MDTSMLTALNANASLSAASDAAFDARPPSPANSLASSEALAANVAVSAKAHSSGHSSGHSSDRAGDREAARLKKRLRELATELVDVLESARLHLARELHDSVGAELTAARFALANVENALSARTDEHAATALDIAQRSLGAACEASRRVVADFHAPSFDGGIVAALSQWTRSFAERTGLATNFTCDADLRLAQLPPEAALAVFRVAQEAIGNVAKHAGASRADVRMKTDAQHLTLIVTDDGRGLPRSAHRRAAGSIGSGGFGLAGMRARCEAFDGTLRVRSNPPRLAEASGKLERGANRGTTVHARFAWRALLEARDKAALVKDRGPGRSGKKASL
ncbi:MAG TPA: ATP-binding protein [Trinickia sp.]|nr:ATP-binding protein [Trinickia sp.]